MTDRGLAPPVSMREGGDGDGPQPPELHATKDPTRAAFRRRVPFRPRAAEPTFAPLAPLAARIVLTRPPSKTPGNALPLNGRRPRLQSARVRPGLTARPHCASRDALCANPDPDARHDAWPPAAATLRASCRARVLLRAVSNESPLVSAPTRSVRHLRSRARECARCESRRPSRVRCSTSLRRL